MRKASIGIAPEGLPFIALLAFSALVFAFFCWPMAVILLALTWFAGHFFRDPERVTPQDPGIAVSPADGKVVKIEPRPDPFSGEMKTCISVFMNVFSVHVNRSPVAGSLKRIAYYPGKFMNAALDKASTDNERCAYDIAGGDGAFTVVQIAGLIARRIVCRAEEGDRLERGERFGLIRFGSRVDVFLPATYEPAVRIGQQVFAGQCVLARKAGRKKESGPDVRKDVVKDGGTPGANAPFAPDTKEKPDAVAAWSVRESAAVEKAAAKPVKKAAPAPKGPAKKAPAAKK